MESVSLQPQRMSMSPLRRLAIVLALTAFGPRAGHAELLFEDRFDKELSDRWEIVGLTKEDYRLRDGGLEVRIQPQQGSDKTPMLKIMLPFTIEDTAIASVEVTVLDEFTHEGEGAALCLLDETGVDFTVQKQRIEGGLFFAPGEYRFAGKDGEEGNPAKYHVHYTPATNAAGPLRIVTRGDHAYFMVGPSDEGKYLTFFHSAVNPKPKRRGFALRAGGGKPGDNHWVRYDNFRVTK